jgi:hypothetical protein
LAALVEACIAASGTARALGHGSLAEVLARRSYEAAQLLGDPALTGFVRMQHAGTLIQLGARRRAATVLGNALVDLESTADPTGADKGPAQAAGMLWSWPAQPVSATTWTSISDRPASRSGSRPTCRRWPPCWPPQSGGDRDAEAIRYLDTADRIAPTRIRNDPT